MRGIVRIVANAYMNGKAYGQQVTTQTRGGPFPRKGGRLKSMPRFSRRKRWSESRAAVIGIRG